MNNALLTNGLRLLGLLLLQGLVLQRISLGFGATEYAQVLLYPLFIILLPLQTPKPLVVLLGFVFGILVDIFYASYGVHAAALVITAFARGPILNFFQPRGGYNMNHSPTKARQGTQWFFRYAAVLIAIHLFFYFSVEAFTYAYIVNVLIKTISSFLLTMIFVAIYTYLFNPLD